MLVQLSRKDKSNESKNKISPEERELCVVPVPDQNNLRLEECKVKKIFRFLAYFCRKKSEQDTFRSSIKKRKSPKHRGNKKRRPAKKRIELQISLTLGKE